MITLSYTIVVQIRCLCFPDTAVGKHLLFLVSVNQHQFLRILKQERKVLQAAHAYGIRDLYIRGRGRLRVRDLTKSFFAYSPNIDFPESFILPFFTRKVSIVILSEGGYALSRPQNDKTFNT